MKFRNTYHKGELLAQKLAGEQRQAEFNGQAIANSIIDGALTFISEQEYVVVSINDPDSIVWASVLTGERGFMQAKNSRLIVIDCGKLDHVVQNPIIVHIKKGINIGLLIIELTSRRRLRVNGKVTKITDDEIHIVVKQAYPNCMKYIQRRQIIHRETWTQKDYPVLRGVKINETHKELITSSDTFFIGSAHPNGNLDVSHRGGNPGFIELVDENIIRIPDYNGNSMFNTLGNLLLNKYAGLVFWDFTNNQVLHLAGSAQIKWGDKNKATYDTGRYWQFEIEQWIQGVIGRKFVWEFLDYSPNNPNNS